MEKLQKLAGYFQSVRSVVGISRFGSWLLFGALIGLVAGLGAIVFRFTVDVCSQFLYGSLAGTPFPTETVDPGGGQLTGLESRHWLFFIFPALGGLVAGWLVFKFAPEAEGHGTDEVIRAFHHERGHIRRRVPLLKMITSALTIGSGPC